MDSFLKYDIPHVGAVLARTREHRGLSKRAVANLIGVNESTITRLEQDGAGKQGRNRGSFLKYVRALQSSNSVRSPLTQKQAAHLRKLYDYSEAHEVVFRSDLFSFLNLGSIKTNDKKSRLGELVSMLEREDRPAFIMDSLWFMHAMNGAVLHLFDIHPQSEYLFSWEAWHPLATKFQMDSPVRRAHYNPDIYFPPTVAQLFWGESTIPYIFTPQMRLLQKRLHKLSALNKTGFTGWWESTISFSLFFELEAQTRIIWHKRKRIYTEVRPRIGVETEVAPGMYAEYYLAIWDPIGSDARKAFNDIRSLDGWNKIYYAADYDKNLDFHVNTWPELL